MPGRPDGEFHWTSNGLDHLSRPSRIDPSRTRVNPSSGGERSPPKAPGEGAPRFKCDGPAARGGLLHQEARSSDHDSRNEHQHAGKQNDVDDEPGHGTHPTRSGPPLTPQIQATPAAWRKDDGKPSEFGQRCSRASWRGCSRHVWMGWRDGIRRPAGARLILISEPCLRSRRNSESRRAGSRART